MTEAQYAAKLINVKKRYERKYYGSIFLALRKQKAPIKAALKNRGAAAAIAEVINMSAKPVEDALRKLYKEIGPYEAEREYRRLKRFQKGLGEPSFDWLADIMTYMEQNILAIVRGPMLDLTKRMIMYKLQEGIATGQSIDDMVKAIADTNIDRNRARLIVRSEINTAMNYGHHLSVTHIGFPVKKIWISAKDFRVRGVQGDDHADHRALNNVSIGYDEFFIDPRNGDRLLFPGDKSQGATAASTANCRCVTIHKPVSGF